MRKTLCLAILCDVCYEKYGEFYSFPIKAQDKLADASKQKEVEMKE
jgi:hypothetical protein